MAAKRKQLRKVHIDGEVWKYHPEGGVPTIWSPGGKKYEPDYGYDWGYDNREYPKNALLPSDVKRYIEEEILGRKRVDNTQETGISTRTN